MFKVEIPDFYKKTIEYPDKTITGNRYKRSEGLIFKILYELHKLLTLIFTGKLIKFGNFLVNLLYNDIFLQLKKEIM